MIIIKSSYRGSDMFATIIKEYRKSLNMSQEEMAYKLRISTNHLSRVERRKVSPSGELIERIITIISNDMQLRDLKSRGTALYGVAILIQMQKLCPEHQEIVFNKVVQLIEELNAKYSE